MCGIIGYIGNKNIENVLIAGLSRLEYRGYDSAGMAVVNKDRIAFLKESGKLSALRALVKKRPLSGSVGIGHTRWATHGEPSQRNAHPHMDCSQKVAVVHNGIIENHVALKKRLLDQGHVFNSDTDTEVLAHLLEDYHVKQKKTLADAVRLLLMDIEGSYAFCAISSFEQDGFVAARNSSPLVVGLGEGENFIASDASAFLEHTHKAIFLNDYQMVEVSRDRAVISSTRGEAVADKVTHIDWDPKDVSKEGFAHYMLKEIEEQPRVIDRILRTRLKGRFEEHLFDELNFDAADLLKVDRILIQACGTSWHAALTGKYFLESLAGLPVEVEVSSEFRYRPLVATPNTLVLSITQSGETLDTLMGLRKGKEKGLKTIAICNVVGSTIARESDGVIYTHAGPEIGVASTKAYTAQLAVLFLLALYWGQIRGTVTGAALKELVQELKGIPQKMEAVISHREAVKAVAEKYSRSRDFLFLGRGVNYPNAFEGALKIKEIAYIHATGHPAGEMKHGPIALIDANMPVVVLAPHAAMYEKMASNAQEVKARGGKIIAVLTEGDEAIRSFANDVIFIPRVHELLSPLLVVLPLQMLAYQVATLRGTDVDQPRNLAKSVTVE